MKYREVVFGEFIERPNRFVAKVRVAGCDDIETVHVKNTGRCRELLVPGARVALETAQTDGAGKAAQKQTRKTKYDLVAVVKENLAGNGPGWVNMDSQAPNKIVKEWLGCLRLNQILKLILSMGRPLQRQLPQESGLYF